MGRLMPAEREHESRNRVVDHKCKGCIAKQGRKASRIPKGNVSQLSPRLFSRSQPVIANHNQDHQKHRGYTGNSNKNLKGSRSLEVKKADRRNQEDEAAQQWSIWVNASDRSYLLCHRSAARDHINSENPISVEDEHQVAQRTESGRHHCLCYLANFKAFDDLFLYFLLCAQSRLLCRVITMGSPSATLAALLQRFSSTALQPVCHC
mmetsp:Transcript_40456/g.75140  ORF Transcript_40456/g.75140 Transcript_40456/m.75140 type:complete len:207 (-) Transcript_40456:346-966(-)